MWPDGVVLSLKPDPVYPSATLVDVRLDSGRLMDSVTWKSKRIPLVGERVHIRELSGHISVLYVAYPVLP